MLALGIQKNWEPAGKRERGVGERPPISPYFFFNYFFNNVVVQRLVFPSLGLHGTKRAAPASVGKTSWLLSPPAVPLIHIGMFDPPGGR